MNNSPTSDVESANRRGFLVLLGILLVVLCFLFFHSFLPHEVLFSNDGPFGAISSQAATTDLQSLGGGWQDLNWFGNEYVSGFPNFNFVVAILSSPEAYARFAGPIGLLALGLSAWLFFRQLKLAPIACVWGGIAAALNSDFFSTACWGIVSNPVCVAANFLALAAIARMTDQSPARKWVRVILAGLAVGMGVMEGWDVGALFSLFVAAYVIYQALFLEQEHPKAAKQFALGATRLAMVAIFATYLATQTLLSLIGTQIQGIRGTQNDAPAKAAHWAEATEWSLPPVEMLQIAVPGLFGYRNEWHMYEDKQPTADQYWGLIGENPAVSFWRLSGTGLYAGVLVVVVSLWGILQSFRKKGSPFSLLERRAIWFWTAMLVITTLMAFGRYLPFFFGLFYALPYASTIRNPTKFMHIFSWVLVIVFAYGAHGMVVAYMQNSVNRVAGMAAQFKNWWAKAGRFERNWMIGCLCAIALAVLGWFIYGTAHTKLEAYLQTVGIAADQAPAVVQFSLRAVGVFILLLVLTIGLLALLFSGQFSGARAKWGACLFGALLVVDLGRADMPWIVYLDTATRYAENPLIQVLADKPFEHRVGILPVPAKTQQQATLQNNYGSAWKQNVFPYYNIQCCEIVQESRVALDKDQFMSAIPPNSFFNLFRFWQLSNTRYILGPADFVPQMDPSGAQLAVVKRFEVVTHSAQPTTWSDWSAQDNTNGDLALIEFKRALPRASLFSNWQVEPNDTNTLQTLANPAFDPLKTVLVADPIPAPLPANAGQPGGTVQINPNYRPKRVELTADVKVPSVLLLCDRFNPRWQVTVDGKPEKVLRCNFIVRGVLLQPGKHDVVFHFTGTYDPFWVSFSAVVLGLILTGWLALTPADGKPANGESRKGKPGKG
jgi:hypothetical protein